jgi:uncharacterized YccA/Bax inhibitor family protein
MALENPALNERSFQRGIDETGAEPRGMSASGTYAIAGLLFVIVVTAAAFGWSQVEISATGGFVLLYAVVWLLSLLGVDFRFLYTPTPLGIGISVLIVILGALNLTLDFAFIERSAEAGAPRFMRWYGAFGLMLSLIWIYVSVLRLLVLLRSRQ